MTIRRRVDIEESIHLSLALVLVVEVFWVQVGVLESASEAIKLCCGSVLSSRVCGSA